MFSPQLQKLGLTKTQASALNYLFEQGESKARDIARATKHPRGVVYKAIEELLALELVERIEKEKQVAHFRALHPGNLEKVLEAKEKELLENKKILEGLLPQLSSSYNLTLNKPGVRFYEGREGLEKVLYDTLASKTEVYLFINSEAMKGEEKFKEVNQEYRQKRIRAQVKKKVIRAGKKPELTFGTSDEKYDAITEIRYLDKEFPNFKSNIHIYDNKVSHQIIDGGKMIGILMEDKNIYEMSKVWFEALWELAKK